MLKVTNNFFLESQTMTSYMLVIDVPDGKFAGYRMEPDGMNYPAAGFRIPDNSRQFRAIFFLKKYF